MVNVRKNRNPFFMAMLVIILIAVLSAAAIGIFTNKSMIDMTYSFERAMIRLPDGDIVEGHVSTGRSYYVNADHLVDLTQVWRSQMDFFMPGTRVQIDGQFGESRIFTKQGEKE